MTGGQTEEQRERYLGEVSPDLRRQIEETEGAEHYAVGGNGLGPGGAVLWVALAVALVAVAVWMVGG